MAEEQLTLYSFCKVFAINLRYFCIGSHTSTLYWYSIYLSNRCALLNIYLCWILACTADANGSEFYSDSTCNNLFVLLFNPPLSQV